MITFFRPEFLWVLLFVFAVILLHLIRRPTFTMLSFSTLMFFNPDAVVASKRRRLFKLLQLLMRIFAIVAIILLFARPYPKDNVLSVINNPSTPLYFWIDNTISMSYVTDSGTLYDIARECVRKAASTKGTNTVYLFDTDVQEFVSIDDSIGKADKQYGEINFQHAMRSFSAVSKEKNNAVLFVISDFQKSSAGYIDSIMNESTNLKNGIVLLSVTPKSPYNFAIHDAAMLRGTVNCLLSQFGGTKDTLHVNCMIDEIENGTVSVVTQRDSTTAFSIETGVNFKSNGYLQIQESDPLLFDNNDFFIDSFRRKKKICIVGDTNANYSLRAALHAANDNYNIRLYQEHTVTFDILDSSDVIILNALQHPCGALNAFIMSNGTQCKTLVCCIDPSEHLSGYYRDILSKAFNDGALKLQSVNIKTNPVLRDTLIDIWKKFRSSKINDVEIYSYVSGINGAILLRYTTSDPFLIHKKDRQERDWVIVTTPLGITADNTLYQSSFYLPMIDRTLSYAEKVKKNNDLVWTCGKNIKNPFFNPGKKNLLYNSHGDFVENLSGLPSLYIDQPGIYKVVSGDNEVVFIKVQHDSLESQMNYLSPGNFKGNKKNVYIGSSGELMQVFDSNNKIGIEMLLWIFLTLALLGEIAFSIRR